MKLSLTPRTYQVFIQPDYRLGTSRRAYTGYIPTLGIASDGETVEEALVNVKEAAAAYVDSLIADGLEIPSDSPFTASASVTV